MKKSDYPFRFLLGNMIILICTFIFTGQLHAHVGQVFPRWSPGYLDIHHINTGKGESAFFIFPDGTTMLVDAGDSDRQRPKRPEVKPNDSRTPGEWISRYILHMLEGQSDRKLDYILVTHFHSDHIGDLSGAEPSTRGNYMLNGITRVGELVGFNKVIDRGWDYPQPSKADYFVNYMEFVNWQVQNLGANYEQFQPGLNDQVILVHDPAGYPGFEFRNIAANGVVWTGFGTNVRNHFPPLESLSPEEFPSENMCSIAFRLAYGRFNYFNGGDIIGGNPGHWRDIETPIAMATGPVDVCIANHHAFFDAMSVSFLQATRPRVHIVQSSCPTHPSNSSLARMMSGRSYPGPRDVFSTNIMDETREIIGPRIDNLKSQQGHIVVRVNPGGATYMIYILDDTEESYRITAVHGPYYSN